MTEKILFNGKECEVIERYEVSAEYLAENQLFYKHRIKFITPDGDVVDCADRFPVRY